MSSTETFYVVSAALMAGAFALYLRAKGKKRSADNAGSEFITAEELKRKRLSRFQNHSSEVPVDATSSLPPSTSAVGSNLQHTSTEQSTHIPTVNNIPALPAEPSSKKQVHKRPKTMESIPWSAPTPVLSTSIASTTPCTESATEPEGIPTRPIPSPVDRFQLKSQVSEQDISTPCSATQTEVAESPPSSSIEEITVTPTRHEQQISAKKQIERLLRGLLAGRHTAHLTTVKIVPTYAASSSRLFKGTLTISVHTLEDKEKEEMEENVAVTGHSLTLQQYLDSLHISNSDFFARDILESCLPHATNMNYSQPMSMSTVKLQLDWLNKVYTLCDPLNDFSRDIINIFEPPGWVASDEATTPHNSLLLGQTILRVFRNACVSIGQMILAPHEKQAAIVMARVTAAKGNDDDVDLPPLFSNERVEVLPSKHKETPQREPATTLCDMMHQQLLSSSYFCGITTECCGVLHSFFARVMEDVRAATTDPFNIFARTDCDCLLNVFPVSALDVLLSAAPALGRLLAQNITVCTGQFTATLSGTGPTVDGVDIMEIFLLTDLFCITHALSIPPVLSFNPSRAAEPWTKVRQSQDKNRLLHSRFEDIDRIVQKVRNVTFEIFKCALCVDKGRNKKEIMEFLMMVLSLSTRRTLGRNDDHHEIARGFEPEGRVFSRHFVYGAVDLVSQLLANGGTRVFNSESVLERRQKELADVTVVQALVTGTLCKCNFDVFLLFSSMLFTSALDREWLRQEYIMKEMRRLIQHNRVSAQQKETLEGYLEVYHWSTSCQTFRADNIDNMGKAADMFCQYLLQLCHSPTAIECFRFIERSPHNLYMCLSFIWTSVARIRRPGPHQVAAAENVVYLSCTLLNRPDLLTDIKQQSHWVNILNSICGNIANVDGDDEFEDECLARKESSAYSSEGVPGGSSKWQRNSISKPSSPQKSTYFGLSRGPFVGAIFDSERNVRDLPVALARLYISCQSVEDWDADRDTSFSKFDLRHRISHLLTACIDHPLHSEAVLRSLSSCAYSEEATLLETLFMSIIDHNTSNLSFFIKTIEVATGPEEMKNKYNSVKFAKQSVNFVLKMCGKNTMLAGRQVEMKLSNQVLQLCQVSALISNSAVELGLHGMRKFLDRHARQLTMSMAALGGDAMLQVIVECCVDKGVRLHLEEDSTGLNERVTARWQQEDAHRAQQQEELQAHHDSDDHHFLTAEVQRTIGDQEFVSKYQDAVSDISNAVESVSAIPGYRFEKLARESREKGASRRQGVMRAWKQVEKCLRNENGDDSFHPNGSILIKHLESDASCARAVISVNAETPFAFGLFFFDIWLPPDYPRIPPVCELLTTGGGSFMLSPNLYSCGKVCMSLLNTAQSSSDIERWQPDESTVAQVLLTIQATLLGDSEPMTKEGKARGSPLSLAYNEEKHFETIRWGMIDALLSGRRHMGDEFGDFIVCHFTQLREQVRLMVRSWWLCGRRNDRIERVFIALLYELKKLTIVPLRDDMTNEEA